MKTLLPSFRKLLAGLLTLAVLPGTCPAQVEFWRIGRGGASWSSQAENQVGAVSVEGGLQPLELVPGQNLTQLLAQFGQAWMNSPPEDFTQGGLPHTWTNSNYFNGLKGPLKLVDGRDTTSTENVFKSSGNPAGTAFFWDLGAAYPINRVRFYSPPEDPDGYLRAFELFVSDGQEYDRSNRPLYRSLRRVETNKSSLVEIDFTTSNTRFIQLRNLSRSAFSLAEFEIYGEGFVPASSYVSALHSFGRAVNFGTLHLEATRLSHAQGAVPVSILQVRDGADDTPLNYFRRDRETGTEVEVSPAEYANQLPRLAFFRRHAATGEMREEVSRDEYLALPVEEQGPIRDFVQGAIRLDAENWNPWSAPMELDSTGAYAFALALPGPRPYLQFRISFAGDAENAMRLDAFRLEYSPLLVNAAVGEVALASTPAPPGGLTAVPSGVDTTFTYDIRAAFDEEGLEGFKGVKVAAFPPPVFARLEMGEPLLPVSQVQVDTTADGFQVIFAPVDRQRNQPIRVIFRQKVLEHHTPIDAWLIGTAGGLPQPVAAGDASSAVTTNATQVFTLDPEPALRTTLSPAVLTPNGDGINDRAELAYTLTQFTGGIQVDIEVFDLAGRRVRQLASAPLSSGAYRADWDGRDAGGAMVPPGNYLCRVRADSDARTFTAVQLIGVVY